MVKDLNDPTNVDSVPAMLTPGEFVLNKEASQMYAPIIEQMNAHGLQQRVAENKNIGGPISLSPAMRNDGGWTSYNVGGLVGFLKEKEGYKDDAYQDDAGVWTIGYGRTTNPDGSPVKPGQTTKREAENKWLDTRAASERSAIDAYAEKYGYDWNDGQKDALASFRYNGGQGMLDMLTEGGTRDNATIQEKFGLYNKVTDPNTGEKVFVQGLQNRRDAELELWGGKGNQVPGNQPEQIPAGTTPTPDPAAMVPDMQAPPPAGGEGESAGFLGGLGSDALSTLGNSLAGGNALPLAPPPGLQGQNPEFIPSVTSSNPRNRNDPGLFRGPKQFNGGGPVQYLNEGGWWSWLKNRGQQAQDPFAGYANMTQAQALQQAQTFNNPGAQTQGYQVPGLEMPRQGQSILPLPPEANASIPRFGQQAGALQGRLNLSQLPTDPGVPQLDNQPPIPGSDEAILQGSSQQVEEKEDSEAQRLKRNAEIRQAAQTLPKGDPRRAALMNQISHQKGVVPTGGIASGRGLSPGSMGPPPAPQPGFSPTGGRGGAPIEQLSEEQIGKAYDAGDPRAIAYAENEEKGFKTDEALRQAQLQQAVTAPDAPGAPFIDARVQALQQQGQDLGSEGTGIVTQPASDPGINQAAPDIPLGPGDVGAVPGIDTSAPTAPAQPDAREQAIAAPKQDNREEQIERGSKNAGDITKVIADKGEDPPPALTQTNKAELAKKVEAAEKTSPGTIQQATNTIKQAFGDLFNEKELVRMGVLFAGALLTGATPGQALAYSGQAYLGRIDAAASTKQKYQHELVKSGKYTPASIKAFVESEDPSTLIPTDPALEHKELGNQKEFYGPNGQRVLAREVQIGENKVWLGPGNKPVSLNTFHQDASRAPGTPEYRKRIGDESKQLGNTFKDMQERFGKFSTKDGDAYSTELIPGKVGLNAAKWAAENDVPLDAMGQLMDNAYQSALADSKGGKKARSITAYLNDQYIRSEVGDPSLFQDKDGNSAEASKVNGLMNLFNSQLGQLPQYQGMSSAAISSAVIQKARPMWTGLEPELRNSYNRRAGPGETGFMVWLRDQVIQPQ